MLTSTHWENNFILPICQGRFLIWLWHAGSFLKLTSRNIEVLNELSRVGIVVCIAPETKDGRLHLACYWDIKVVSQICVRIQACAPPVLKHCHAEAISRLPRQKCWRRAPYSSQDAANKNIIAELVKRLHLIRLQNIEEGQNYIANTKRRPQLPALILLCGRLHSFTFLFNQINYKELILILN